MKKILGVFLGMAISSTAFADTNAASVEAEQFKAVADSVFTQHKIADDESIRAIINARENSGGRIFVIQYLDQAGKCTQEGVDVFTRKNADGALKTNVTFFRIPRQKCE